MTIDLSRNSGAGWHIHADGLTVGMSGMNR